MMERRRRMSQKKPLSESNKKWLIFLGVTAAGMLLIALWLIYKNTPLDRLREYEVHVDVNRDGTMEITYHYRWEVLNDSREGPLTWVELGLANSQCELTDYGGAVTGLHYGYRNGLFWENLIGLDLDREYCKGEVVDFYFTVHQEGMLCENAENASLPFYDFTPGWFENMPTEHYLFTWSDRMEIQESNADRIESGVHVWEGRLKKGEKRRMKVYYAMEAFEEPELVQWARSYGGTGNDQSEEIANVLIYMLVVVFFGYRLAWGRDKYENGRGYYRGGSHHSGTGGCACACAGCACACACAGGGRAGCSKKDFFISIKEEPKR